MTNLSNSNLSKLLAEATKGPWAAINRERSWDWVVYSEADPNIEICQPFHDGTEDNELGEANASLIALTPDLAAEVLMLRKALTSAHRVLADLVGGDKSLSTMHLYAQAVEAEIAARAALDHKDHSS